MMSFGMKGVRGSPSCTDGNSGGGGYGNDRGGGSGEKNAVSAAEA